jgi:hypothetical protein
MNGDAVQGKLHPEVVWEEPAQHLLAPRFRSKRATLPAPRVSLRSYEEFTHE